MAKLNLDRLLTKDSTEQEVSAVEKFTSWTPIDMYGLLESISYQLPKGYPTVDKGVFTEINEVLIINEALQAEGLPTLPLPEAGKVKVATKKVSSTSVSQDDALKYVQKVVTNIKAYPSEAVENVDMDEETKRTTIILGLPKLPLNPEQERSERVNIIKSMYMQLSTLAASKSITLTPKNYKEGITNFVITYANNDIVYAVKRIGKLWESDTNIKEGLSVIISYYPDYLPSPSTMLNKKGKEVTIPGIGESNVNQIANKLIKFINFKEKNGAYSFNSVIAGLSAGVVKSVYKFLQRVKKDSTSEEKKAFASILNQNSSHANTFDDFFQKNPNWYIERDVLFNKIRSVGSKITTYSPDKWCPGDVYFVDSTNNIEDILTKAELANSNGNTPQALSLINSLFSDKFNQPEKKASIVAVSLKMAQAQAGKLKSALKEYSNIDKTYSLTKDEITDDEKYYIEGIKSYQLKLKKVIGKHVQKGKTINSTIEWEMMDPLKIQGTKQTSKLQLLRYKFAAYKAIDFILNHVATDVYDLDDKLVSLTAFGMSVINKSTKADLAKVKDGYINPPFFKVIADANGSKAKPVLFQQGATLGLYTPGNPNGTNLPVISILDSKNYGGLQIGLGLVIGDDHFDCMISLRGNGSSQIAIELNKADHE